MPLRPPISPPIKANGTAKKRLLKSDSQVDRIARSTALNADEATLATDIKAYPTGWVRLYIRGQRCLVCI